MRKPKLFIGSSVEGLNVAYAFQENLQYTAECTVWDQGVFNLSESSLESLIKTLNNSDFGVFVFTPDDQLTMRGQSNIVARDNVIFELGLFVGRLGRERSFIIMPNNIDFHLPTDLLGISPAKYDNNRSDKNLLAATGSAANQIRNLIKTLGFSSNSEGNNLLEATEQTNNLDTAENTWIEDYWLKKDYDSALQKLSTSILEEKDHLRKIRLRGYLCEIEYAKNLENGHVKFEEYIAENENVSVAYERYASALFKNNLTGKAIEILDVGLDKCNSRLGLVLAKAEYLSLIGESEKALLNLKDEQKRLDLPEISFKLAQLLDKNGQKKEALLEFLAAYIKNPQNENFVYEFAKACYDSDYKNLSMLLYKDLLKDHKLNSTYWAYLGNTYLDLELYDSALKAYEQANELAKGKQGWILANIGNLYSHKKLYICAERFLTKSLEVESKSEYTLKRLSEVYKGIDEEDNKIKQLTLEAKMILHNKFQTKEISFDE